jgi:hypothetical protein
VEPPVLPVLAKQDTKRETKEMTRYNVLLCQTQSLISTLTLMREKQAAVTALMDLANNKSNKPKAIKTKKPKATQLKTIPKVPLKVKPNKGKKTKTLDTKTKHQPIVDWEHNTRERVRTTETMHVSGCRHGNLNAMKCTAQAKALHYIRPDKFLANKGCLDCQKTVVDMQPAASNQRIVLYYCDQGIKGYDAPDNDDMKLEQVCNLALCVQCKAV